MEKSIGLEVPFKFNSVQSTIKLVDYGETGKIFITIDKYVDKPVKIGTNWLTYCLLYRLVGNRVIDERPDIVKYFANKSDAYRCAVYSSRYVEVVCPICKRKRLQQVNNLCSQGFFCDMCSDGVSMPNKIMYFILEQCKVNFINEVSRAKGFDWIANQYRYDFYFQSSLGDDILIELDGGFHRSIEQQNVDKAKDILAKNNGYHIIRIDCDYKNKDAFQFIKNNIINSELCEILPLDMIDWDLCYNSTKNSLVDKVCNLWEQQEYSVHDIVNILNLSRPTILTYLKKGKKLGLCQSYNCIEDSYRSRNPYISIYKQGVFVNAFRHIYQLYEQSRDLFGVDINIQSAQHCYDKKQAYQGFNIKRITREEYLQYKMINNNGVVKEDDKQ